MTTNNKEIWVFGDYRNYFQNRVTLQLLARATTLAQKTGGKVCAIVFGYDTDEYVNEYIAHGAHKIYVLNDQSLANYSIDRYVSLMVNLSKEYNPDIFLIGATSFGREFAPRVAKRLKTGLTADCIGLDINDDLLLVQTAPSFGGNLLAEIVTPDSRPQMATVRPGIFKELPHNYHKTGKIIKLIMPENLPKERVRLIRSQRQPQLEQSIEKANVVICAGRGMGTKKKFKKLYDLAALLNGEIGATRPLVYSNWIDHNALVGQAGKQIRPKVLFSFGISGAIQHTAAIIDSDFIIAVNKNPNAAMMKMADVAIVADANQLSAALIKELKKRLRT